MKELEKSLDKTKVFMVKLEKVKKNLDYQAIKLQN